MKRQNENAETWKRLREWQRGQPAAERLAGQILAAEGFQSIDPSHPLGGPDGLKDFKCKKDGQLWIAAVYFPRGEHRFAEVKKKFSEDAVGIEANKADAFAFITNQELTLGEREELKGSVTCPCEIYHLELLSHILNMPACFGTRLDFLDIEMTKEEQLSFFARLTDNLGSLADEIRTLKEAKHPSQKDPAGIPKVRPQTRMTSLINSMMRPRLHTCPKCQTLYEIEPDFTSPTILTMGERYIECPECHFKEKYVGSLYGY